MMRLAILATGVATPTLADPGSYGQMMDWGHGNGAGMIFGPVLWLIVLGLVIAGVVWFVRGLDGMHDRNVSPNARAELDLRFARGEIDAEDYASRKKLLGS